MKTIFNSSFFAISFTILFNSNLSIACATYTKIYLSSIILYFFNLSYSLASFKRTGSHTCTTGTLLTTFSTSPTFIFSLNEIHLKSFPYSFTNLRSFSLTLPLPILTA